MLGAAGEWLTTVIAAVFFLALLLAGGLFLTGRGFRRDSLVAMLSVWRNAALCVHRGGMRLRDPGPAAPVRPELFGEIGGGLPGQLVHFDRGNRGASNLKCRDGAFGVERIGAVREHG